MSPLEPVEVDQIFDPAVGLLRTFFVVAMRILAMSKIGQVKGRAKGRGADKGKAKGMGKGKGKDALGNGKNKSEGAEDSRAVYVGKNGFVMCVLAGLVKLVALMASSYITCSSILECSEGMRVTQLLEPTGSEDRNHFPYAIMPQVTSAIAWPRWNTREQSR